MGDRTYVTLYVNKEHAQIVSTLVEAEVEDTVGVASGEMAYFGFDDVNYGELEELPRLQEKGIAYDSHWEAGDEYGPGVEYCRFTPEGEMIVQTVYEDGNLDGFLDDLIKYRRDPQKRDELILRVYSNRTPMSWENQVEYGQRYLANELLAPGVKPTLAATPLKYFKELDDG